MSNNNISRKEFLKKTGLGALAFLLAGKSVTNAAVSDNVGGGGNSVHIASTTPASTEMIWIDTGNEGCLKYHNGTKWENVRATWQ